MEFLGTVDGQKFYDLLMQKVIALADQGSYEGVYIPTDPGIHSNRSVIQQAIRQAKYPTETIPTVRWNRSPRAYDFDRVYVVWERKAAN